MHDRSQSGWFGPRAQRRLLTALTLMVLALAVRSEIFGANGLLALRARQREYRQEFSRVKRLESDNRRLHTDVHQLRSDPSAIERIAREQLHLTRKGEMVFTYPARDLKSHPTSK